MIKRIVYIILTVIILAGSIYLAAYAGSEHRSLLYRSFSLNIVNPLEQPLITEQELLDTLEATFGRLDGRNLNSVPLYEIEHFISSNPYVVSGNVFATLNGELSATVTTRVPLLRVFNSYGETFLIDTSGIAMPVSPVHPVRLPVASGHIEQHYIYHKNRELDVKKLESGVILKDLYHVARLISQDVFLNALIGQIYVNENLEMEFIPRIGNQVILFGNSENAREKLEKMKAFYHQVIKYTGWDTYKIINLTFDNQVVCSK